MLLRDLVGWMIAITRRWAIGSAESVKTIRAKTGTTIVLVFYLLGFSMPIYLWLSRGGYTAALNDKKAFNAVMLVSGVIVLLGPFMYVFKTFSQEVVQEYVVRHTPRSKKHAVLQSVYALLFIAGAWWMVFGMPLLVY